MSEGYACKTCGYKATNTGYNCDLGCGRDYNEMIKLPESLVRQLDQYMAQIHALRVENMILCKVADAASTVASPLQPASVTWRQEAMQRLRDAIADLDSARRA